jgi:hypothetical protein
MKRLDRKQLKVGNFIEPQGFPRGQIVTIEHCTLESFIDGKIKKRWPCWTVRTEAPRPLHKYLITDWGKGGLILWKKSKLKFAPKDSKLWVERSGLEEMENLSDRKADHYVYSMLMFILDTKSKKPKKLYCIERLRNDRVFRYEGFRIG